MASHCWLAQQENHWSSESSRCAEGGARSSLVQPTEAAIISQFGTRRGSEGELIIHAAVD